MFTEREVTRDREAECKKQIDIIFREREKENERKTKRKERESIESCPKAFTFPLSEATTPFLLTTLQLACLTVAGFRSQAHTNNRYALLCSDARL